MDELDTARRIERAVTRLEILLEDYEDFKTEVKAEREKDRARILSVEAKLWYVAGAGAAVAAIAGALLSMLH
jgi:hypothetical protein